MTNEDTTQEALKLINAKDHQGKTPLHKAAEEGNVEVLKKLLFFTRRFASYIIKSKNAKII